MTAALGKRKRGAPKEDEGEGENDKAQLQALLQRHFEARFKPLDATFSRPAEDEDGDEDDDTLSDFSDSEWDGISEGDDDGMRDSSPTALGD